MTTPATVNRFGPWSIGAVIASGGLASVARARRESCAEVALKRLHTHHQLEPQVADLFAREQTIACSLPAHPRVASGLEWGDVEGRAFLASRLCDGADLRRRHGDVPRLPLAEALALVIDATEAIVHIHAHGWIHGDVNPTNLIVDDAGRATLCDFGIARAGDEPGPARGTPAYMAPEQVRGEAWTPATDVFALGVVLWELAAGQRLFHRGASYLTLGAVIDAEVPALPDPALDAIARAALAKRLVARLPSAAELLARLRGWVRL